MKNTKEYNDWMKFRCKLGIHKYRTILIQTVPGMLYGDGPISRAVMLCSCCGKVSYKILNIFARAKDCDNLIWEPKYEPDIRDTRKYKLRRIL